jgi:pyruvate dehydrogenase E1 component alpha subunit
MQISRDKLKEAYKLMRTIRVFEDRVHAEFQTGTMPGFVHLYAGEEASAVGVCMHLTDKDRITSTHRGHGHCIAKGCDVSAMMKELYGSRDGLCRGKGGSMHIADLSKGMMGANGIVGGGPPLACGAALAAKTLGHEGIAVSFVGDGGSNQGTTLESLNFASVMKLPVVFVFENNGYAEATSSKFSVGGGDIVKRAPGFGIPGVQIDGTDFFEVHRACGEAIDRARAGQGPSLIEIKLERFYGHYEGDQQTYRGPSEGKIAREERDCLKIFSNRVTAAGLLDQADLDTIDLQVARLIDDSVDAARTAARPTAEDLLTDVYISY